MAERSSALQAVIFDLDGTLADTEEAHRRAFNATFRAHGLLWNWDPDRYRDLLAVTGGRERMRHYCKRFFPSFLDDPHADAELAALHREKTRRYAEFVAARRVHARPGIVRLLLELRAAGVRLAIATTTSRSNVDALLTSALSVLPADTFEVIGAAEQASSKKPSPMIYRWVLDQLGLSADRCLAVEDSQNGVRAALGAGLPVLVTECAWTTGEDFSGALAVLSDLGEPGQPYGLVSGADPAPDKQFIDAAALRRFFCPL